MPGYKWVRYNGTSNCESEMVVIGRDRDGKTLVVGKAHHDGDELPAKVKPEHGIAYVSHNGKEHEKRDFEILVRTPFTWVPSSNGNVPNGAVEGGRTSDGETLYIGRCMHNETHVVGKVHPSHGTLYVPYDGKEFAHTEYEVLVYHSVHQHY